MKWCIGLLVWICQKLRSATLNSDESSAHMFALKTSVFALNYLLNAKRIQRKSNLPASVLLYVLYLLSRKRIKLYFFYSKAFSTPTECSYNQYNNLYIYIENKQENNVNDTRVLHSDRSNFTREERSAMWLWRLI